MITERNEAFGVRVYRGQERCYEWIGTFKFRDYGGRRGARKAAEVAEAEARFRGTARQRRTLTIEAYVERYLGDYRERQKDSAYVTASSRLAPFRREFGHFAARGWRSRRPRRLRRAPPAPLVRAGRGRAVQPRDYGRGVDPQPVQGP